jgi:hypothetical protein
VALAKTGTFPKFCEYNGSTNLIASHILGQPPGHRPRWLAGPPQATETTHPRIVRDRTISPNRGRCAFDLDTDRRQGREHLREHDRWSAVGEVQRGDDMQATHLMRHASGRE